MHVSQLLSNRLIMKNYQLNFTIEKTENQRFSLSTLPKFILLHNGGLKTQTYVSLMPVPLPFTLPHPSGLFGWVPLISFLWAGDRVMDNPSFPQLTPKIHLAQEAANIFCNGQIAFYALQAMWFVPQLCCHYGMKTAICKHKLMSMDVCL